MRRRETWGGAVRFDTGSPHYLGWIVATKHAPNHRILEVLADQPTHPAFLAEKAKLETPYWIHVLELDRAVHEAGGYETNADYRRKELHRFETRAAAEAWLLARGVAMDELRDPRDVDAP
ncbi:MAG: hypothetical protein JJ863_39180 [Deltaproteobacteria bacterium]|nr:hypothetical protein [Deltaproteobacteria bacterium]